MLSVDPVAVTVVTAAVMVTLGAAVCGCRRSDFADLLLLRDAPTGDIAIHAATARREGEISCRLKAGVRF